MKIIFNDGRRFSGALREELNRVFDYIIEFLKQPQKTEVSVSIVSGEEIKTLNRENRNKDSVTDVLSFPCLNVKAGEILNYNRLFSLGEIDFETQNINLGDVIICKERTEMQAKEFGHSYNMEVIRLFTHSVLHLLGYDHIEDKDYKIMHKKEIEILNNLGYTFEE